MRWIELIGAVWHRLGPTQLGLVALGCSITVVGAALTFLTHSYHQSPRTLRGFFRFCFPPHIVLGRQARLDVVYATITRLLRPLFLRWAFIGEISFALFFYTALCHLLRPGARRPPSHHAATGLESVAFVVVTIVVADFFTFLPHYLEHKIPLLWQFHKVHHSALSLIPMTNLRFHPVQEAWDGLWTSAGLGAWIAVFSYVTAAPLADATILGINAILLVNFCSFYQLRHSHIYMRYPAWLERILMSPAQHQIHHSRDEKHLDRNFGLLLSCWDQLFGTIVYSEPVPATNFGLASDQDRYLTISSLFLAPFTELAGKAAARAADRQRRRGRPSRGNDAPEPMTLSGARADELRSPAKRLADATDGSGTPRAANASECFAEQMQRAADPPAEQQFR